MSTPDLSRLRQMLRERYSPNPNDLGAFLSDQPLVRGTLYRHRRRCGKRTCRCVGGDLHESLVLTATIGGKTRFWKPALGRVEGLRECIERYRQFRRARAGLVKDHARRLREMLRLIDAIAKARTRQP